MKWFKHETTARNDVKLRLLKKKYGLAGYGAYFSLLEVIGEYISSDNIDEWGFVDETHSVETLAEDIECDPKWLKKFLKDCNKLKLFEKKEHRLFCEAIIKRLSEYESKLLLAAKRNRDKKGTSPDNIPTISGHNRDVLLTDKNRTDKIRLEENIVIAEKQQSKTPVKEKVKKQDPYKRLDIENRKMVHRVGYFLEDTLDTKIVNWGKQAKAVGMMERAGYTEEQMKYVIEEMWKEDFWRETGFDLMDVANQIAKYKAKGR